MNNWLKKWNSQAYLMTRYELQQYMQKFIKTIEQETPETTNTGTSTHNTEFTSTSSTVLNKVLTKRNNSYHNYINQTLLGW